MKVGNYEIEPYAKLRGADLEGADLEGADLEGADLRNADLRNANLRGANLRFAVLQCANLRGANLRGADLQYADLQGADLQGAELRYAELRYAVGNMRELRSLQFDTWPVVVSSDTMAIGCQQHPIESWWGFSDEEIARMDPEALEWWRKWKPVLQALLSA